jgi:hypothetical protein
MSEPHGTPIAWPLAAGLAASILGLLLFLELFEPWNSTLLWREIFNFGHLPLFGMIGILLLRLTGLTVGGRLSVLSRYGAALAITILLAALSEVVQIGGPRDADFYDFLRDVAGALSFLLVHLSYDRVARQSTPAIAAKQKRSLFPLAAAALIVVSAFPLVRLSIAWVNRDRMFPTLFSFEHWWEQPFVNADNAAANVVSQQKAERSRTANHVLRVDFRAATYTGLILQDFSPDWRGYTYLGFSVYSWSSEVVRLRLRIDDAQAHNRRDDRFERIIDLQPGKTEIRLPLAEIERGPRDRRLSMEQIKRIVMFSAGVPRREFSLSFDNFLLD